MNIKKTKIICTLGPSTKEPLVLENMLKAGMNVARLNFSHGTHEEHKKNIELFRSVRDKLNIPAAVLLDTKGPEIRFGSFVNGGVKITKGDKIILTTEEILGDATKAYINYKDLPSQLVKDNVILVDDGKLSLVVESTTENEIYCKVKNGGILSDHKSVNVPYVNLNMEYLNDKDKKDLLFGIENDVDFIAASFVRRKEDIIDLRKFLEYNGGRNIKIISKIENIEGVNNFDEILKYSDGIMIARGDMGVEVEYERLPGLQKRFIKKCYKSGKMVVTATQMLDSMINSPSPTRAEITDVANAVFDGTSAIMLSGESAIGKYPVKAVEVMSKIAIQAEKDLIEIKTTAGIHYEVDTDTTNAVCDASCRAARDLNAKAIIAVTKNGSTARSMSKFRPNVPIIAATPEEKTFHQLSLSWGVYPVLAKYQHTTDDLFAHAVACAKQIDMVETGDKVVITAGVPLNITGNTNLLKVETVY